MPEARRVSANLFLTAMERAGFMASQEHTPRAFVGASSITTTTFDHPQVDATLVGKLIVVEDGNSQHCTRRCKSVSGTVATLDKAIPSTTGVTTFRAWQTPDYPIRATGSGSTTTIVSSDHASKTAMPDDYLVDLGYQAIFFGGQNAGKASLLTAFVSSTGTYTFNNAITSTVAGEVAYVGKALRPLGGTVDIGGMMPATVERPIVGSASPDLSLVTEYESPTVGFSLEVRPNNGVASGATGAIPPAEAGDLLADTMTQTRDGSSTVAFDTSTTVTVGVGHGARFTKGGFVLLESGELAQIMSISSDTLTLATGQFNNARVSASSAVYGACWYKRKVDGFFTRSFRMWRGGKNLQEFFGCAGTLSMEIKRNSSILMKFAYSAAEAVEYNVDRPVAASASLPIILFNDFGQPIDAKYSRFLIDGTAVIVNDLNVDFGFAVTRKERVGGMNSAGGFNYETGTAKASWKMRAEEDDEASFEDMVDRVKHKMIVQLLFQQGSTAGRTFGLGMPRFQLTKCEQVDDGRYLTYQCEGHVVDTRVETSYEGLPELAIGFA